VVVPLNVRDFLDRAAAASADLLAVVDEPDQPAEPWGELTYASLARLARAQAAKLDELGVERGGRVAFVTQNSARLLASFFGVSGWGRVIVPINFRLAVPEIKQILEHSGAEVLYVDPARADLLGAVDIKHGFVLGADDDLLDLDGVPVEWTDADELAPASLNYTSGTTGVPKGVQLSHRSLWLNAAVFGLHVGLSDRDVFLHTLPMFHVNGWGMPYAVTGVGGTHIVLRQVDGAEILRRIDRHGVTILCAAPTVIDAVLAAAESWVGEIPGRHQVRVIVAGASPGPRTIERVESALGWEFIQIYGQTESSPLITINRANRDWDNLDPHSRAERLGRAGVPALGVKVKIDESSGEILSRSNHSLTAYWRDPDATAAVGAGTWLRTGDVGRIDPDGHLVVTDRIKDIIISGGENVSSIEVENVLTMHAKVQEAAVIGIPDEIWGELVTAVIVAGESSVSAEELLKHCREHLAGYKCPKKFLFVDSLSRTATGKLQKHKLRQIHSVG
jgi:fatty-acyl-CoA synthase